MRILEAITAFWVIFLNFRGSSGGIFWGVFLTLWGQLREFWGHSFFLTFLDVAFLGDFGAVSGPFFEALGTFWERLFFGRGFWGAFRGVFGLDPGDFGASQAK